MKKFFMSLLMIVCMPAMATTICADDDVIAIVLDPTVSGTWNGMHFGDTLEWGVKYKNGTIWGVSACVDTPGTIGLPVKDLKLSNGESVVGGEISGTYCWCKITHPTVSEWGYMSEYATLDCSSQCPMNCARWGSYSTERIHTTLFGSFLYK